MLYFINTVLFDYNTWSKKQILIHLTYALTYTFIVLGLEIFFRKCILHGVSFENRLHELSENEINAKIELTAKLIFAHYNVD